MGIGKIKELVASQYHKQDREDRSLDWNLGFNQACKLILDMIDNELKEHDKFYDSKDSYWSCMIGPARRASITHEQSHLLINVVEKQWSAIFADYPETMAYGPVDKKEMMDIAAVRHDAFWRRIQASLKKGDENGTKD